MNIVRELLIGLEGVSKGAQELPNSTTHGEDRAHETSFAEGSCRELDEALTAVNKGYFDSLSAADELDVHHAINFIKAAKESYESSSNFQ